MLGPLDQNLGNYLEYSVDSPARPSVSVTFRLLQLTTPDSGLTFGSRSVQRQRITERSGPERLDNPMGRSSALSRGSGVLAEPSPFRDSLRVGQDVG